MAHVMDNVNAITRLFINVENQIADGVTATQEGVQRRSDRDGIGQRGAYMSNRFWTIFVFTWAFGPFVLWVSVLSAANLYYRIQRSMKLLIDQIHETHHPVKARRASQ